MIATKQGIECLNSLLRGELAATETYQQALAKMDTTPHAADLRRLHIEHREAANILRRHIHHCGGESEQSSGIWGAWAHLVEGTAKLFGNLAALKALKDGEEQGVEDYEHALQDDGLSPNSKNFIRTRLLDQTREHVGYLNHMMRQDKLPMD